MAIAAAGFLLVTGSSWADPLPGEHPLLNHRFSINVGGFFPEINSEIRLDSELLGVGTTLDFEGDLGFEDTKSTFWGGGRWRISRRNNLELEWVRIHRSATAAGITEAYQIGDSVIQAGGRIDSKFDIDVLRLTYGFSIIRGERSELQLQAGLHIADVQTGLTLTGAVTVNNDPNVRSVSSEGSDLTAPLPHIGGNLTYAFSDKFAFYGSMLGFALEFDNVDGSLLEAGGTFQYNFTRHIGLGAGVRFLRVDVEAGDSNLRGEFEYDYLGPVVYGNVTF